MNSKGFLCVSCEFKGAEFIEMVADLGHRVYLITGEAHKEDPWPYDKITEAYFMPGDDGRKWDVEQLVLGLAHSMRTHKIDRFVALDDYDVNKVAYLREVFRMPGMGQTTARHFYDKLAMRIQAQSAGLVVPGFSSLFNDADVNHFLHESRAPWFIKPRSDAGTHGIRKVSNHDEFWKVVDGLGDDRHRYLVEEFTPGPVFHVDSISFNNTRLFTKSSQYIDPPYNVAHGGGIFQSCTLDIADPISDVLLDLNNSVLKAFGMKYGASHTEFILHEDKFLFLETSARVGGANLSVLVEKATGINLWKEWAKIEVALLEGTEYELPRVRHDNAGIIASLSNTEWPDYSKYTDPEIVWTLNKKHHIGFIFEHPEQARVKELLVKYSNIIGQEYMAVLPPKE